MLGMIFFEFKHYVLSKYGLDEWNTLLERTKVTHHDYMGNQVYSDQDLAALLRGLSEMKGRSVADIEEDFGVFIAPFLARMSQVMIDPSWEFIDVLMHTQETIHNRIQRSIKMSTTPFLDIQRTAPNQVSISYDSKRKMCGFAKGLIKGLAQYYQTQIRLEEPECMHKGNVRCLFVVTVLNPKKQFNPA
jgi:predicted hydrocarbon binding protein